MTGEGVWKLITNTRQVEPMNTQGSSENNSSIHHTLAQPRVVNKIIEIIERMTGLAES